jgi:hypothetical protein
MRRGDATTEQQAVRMEKLLALVISTASARGTQTPRSKERLSVPDHFRHSVGVRNGGFMRGFFIAVGVLSWVWAISLLWIFSEEGGTVRFVAAGVYAIVAMVALGFERILKTLEDIRDRTPHKVL